MRTMLKWLGATAAVAIGFFSSLAIADYTILDSTGTTKTVKAFVCETTKICTAHVPMASDGTELFTLAAPGYVRPGAIWSGTTTWTTTTGGGGTAANTDLVLFCGNGSPAVLLNIVGSGTITTGTAVLQYSNDATDCSGSTGTFASLPQSAIVTQFPLAPVTGTITLTTGQTALTLLPSAARVVRLRLTAQITGASGAVAINTTVNSTNPVLNGLLNPLAAGSAVIGDVGIDQTRSLANAVQPIAGTTGGSSTTGNIVANNTTAVVVKASPGTLYSAQLYGIGSVPVYVKFYNATSATCGSGTPIKRLMIPAASTAANGAGSNIDFGPAGIAFSTGITYCAVTDFADGSANAPAASSYMINLDWK